VFSSLPADSFHHVCNDGDANFSGFHDHARAWPRLARASCRLKRSIRLNFVISLLAPCFPLALVGGPFGASIQVFASNLPPLSPMPLPLKFHCTRRSTRGIPRLAVSAPYAPSNERLFQSDRYCCTPRTRWPIQQMLRPGLPSYATLPPRVLKNLQCLSAACRQPTPMRRRLRPVRPKLLPFVHFDV